MAINSSTIKRMVAIVSLLANRDCCCASSLVFAPTNNRTNRVGESAERFISARLFFRRAFASVATQAARATSIAGQTAKSRSGCRVRSLLCGRTRGPDRRRPIQGKGRTKRVVLESSYRCRDDRKTLWPIASESYRYFGSGLPVPLDDAGTHERRIIRPMTRMRKNTARVRKMNRRNK